MFIRAAIVADATDRRPNLPCSALHPNARALVRSPLAFKMTSRSSYNGYTGKLVRVLGFIHRMVYAALISLVGWIVCVLPHLQNGASWCKVLNWPVSVVGQFIPGWSGINVVSAGGGCDFCTPTERLRDHLALAITLYVAVFYVPNAVAGFVRRRQRSNRYR